MLEKNISYLNLSESLNKVFAHFQLSSINPHQISSSKHQYISL